MPSETPKGGKYCADYIYNLSTYRFNMWDNKDGHLPNLAKHRQKTGHQRNAMQCNIKNNKKRAHFSPVYFAMNDDFRNPPELVSHHILNHAN